MSFSPNNPQLICTSLKNWRSADLSNCFHSEVKGFVHLVAPRQDYMWKWVWLNLVYSSARVHSYALSFLNKHESTIYSTYMLLCVVFTDVLTHMCTLYACFRFFRLYHNAVSMRVKELASEDLEANEIVSLLTWVLNTYKRYTHKAHFVSLCLEACM